MEIRDLESLRDRDLTADDAKAIDEYFNTNEKAAEYWSDRQICWKARVEDIVRIDIRHGGYIDPKEIFTNMAEDGVTMGWPEVQIDEATGLAQIGIDHGGSPNSPYGACWITVNAFQFDDCALIPADADFLTDRCHHENIELRPW